MQPVFKRLIELEIPAEGNRPTASISPDTELKNRVLRRAEVFLWEFDTPASIDDG
jgi:hypothetical protein